MIHSPAHRIESRMQFASKPHEIATRNVFDGLLDAPPTATPHGRGASTTQARRGDADEEVYESLLPKRGSPNTITATIGGPTSESQ